MKESNKCYLYKVTAPNSKVYIGISYNPSHRLSQHKSDELSALYPVIQKHGIENLNHEVLLGTYSREEAERLEVEFIAKYDSYNNGYNRTRGGDGCGKPKTLTKKDVLEINELLDKKEMNLRDIAEKFNVREPTIRSINSGKTWSYVTNNTNKSYRSGYKSNSEDKYNTTLSNEDVVNIKKQIMNGDSLADIARRFNQKPDTIGQIKAGRNWKNIYVEGFDKVKADKKMANKLTMEDAREIRRMKSEGIKTGIVTKKFNISRTTLSNIVRNKTFKE